MDASEACAPSSTGAPGTLCPRPLRPRLPSARLPRPQASATLETPVASLSSSSLRRGCAHTLQLCDWPLMFLKAFIKRFPGHGRFFPPRSFEVWNLPHGSLILFLVFACQSCVRQPIWPQIYMIPSQFGPRSI